MSIGGVAISPSTHLSGSVFKAIAETAANGLTDLLRAKNGFYAFESALHFYPAQRNGIELGLPEWNGPELWVSEYKGLADGCFFLLKTYSAASFARNKMGATRSIPRRPRCSVSPMTSKAGLWRPSKTSSISPVIPLLANGKKQMVRLRQELGLCRVFPV